MPAILAGPDQRHRRCRHRNHPADQKAPRPAGFDQKGVRSILASTCGVGWDVSAMRLSGANQDCKGEVYSLGR